MLCVRIDNIRSTILMVLALLFTNCLSSQKVVLEQDGVHFSVLVKQYGKELERNIYKVTGTLSVSNKTDAEIEYSNKDLYLMIKTEGESRTWLDSLTSHYIDIDTVKIGAGETKKYQVYWALPPVKSISAERIHLEWRQP
jgi:hypothetical protein